MTDIHPGIAHMVGTPSSDAPVAKRRKGPPKGFRKKPVERKVIIEADFTPPEEKADTFSDLLHSKDEIFRERYMEKLNKNEALYELGRLRKISEIAAESINRRIVPDETKCYVCEKSMTPGMTPRMMKNVKDEATGIVTTHPICSIDCVREFYRRTDGRAGIPDRGEEASR